MTPINGIDAQKQFVYGAQTAPAATPLAPKATASYGLTKDTVNFKGGEDEQEEGFISKHWGKMLLGLAAVGTGAYFMFRGKSAKVVKKLSETAKDAQAGFRKAVEDSKIMDNVKENVTKLKEAKKAGNADAIKTAKENLQAATKEARAQIKNNKEIKATKDNLRKAVDKDVKEASKATGKAEAKPAEATPSEAQAPQTATTTNQSFVDRSGRAKNTAKAQKRAEQVEIKRQKIENATKQLNEKEQEVQKLLNKSKISKEEAAEEMRYWQKQLQQAESSPQGRKIPLLRRKKI